MNVAALFFTEVDFDAIFLQFTDPGFELFVALLLLAELAFGLVCLALDDAMRSPERDLVVLKTVHKDLRVLVQINVDGLPSFEFAKVYLLGLVANLSVVFLITVLFYKQLGFAVVSPSIDLTVFLDCKRVILACVNLTNLLLINYINKIWFYFFAVELFCLLVFLTDA